jgi:nitroimidazol reductase NimA-like FMN-containing flavoprotein (pyridoxamine 5'-phosphate oxidase superfamily)
MAPDAAPERLPTVPLLITDHQGMDLLTPEECRALLADEEIGRVGFIDNGQTVILPVNYVFSADSVLFRTAEGSKLAMAKQGAGASFEIDGWDRESRTGWSVLVKGRAAEVTDQWMIAVCERLGIDPWADHFPRDNWVRISMDEVSGRWIFRPGRAAARPGAVA